MAELCILVSDALPRQYQGSFRDFCLKPLGAAYRISIEDFFYKAGQRLRFPDSQFVISMTSSWETVQLNRPLLQLGEFALALLAADGHPRLAYAAVMKRGECVDCQQLASSLSSFAPVHFASNVKGDGAAQWICRCFLAHKRNCDRLEVTAHRYIRYSRFTDPADALFDLCIALESLLNAQTEVSFRFGLSLVKLLGLKGTNAQNTAKLLANLYNFRSKLAHGAPNPHKLLEKMQPDLSMLRDVARRIFVAYVLFLGDNSRQQWDEHLESLIYE